MWRELIRKIRSLAIEKLKLSINGKMLTKRMMILKESGNCKIKIKDANVSTFIEDCLKLKVHRLTLIVFEQNDKNF